MKLEGPCAAFGLLAAILRSGLRRDDCWVLKARAGSSYAGCQAMTLSDLRCERSESDWMLEEPSDISSKLA